MTGDTNPMHLNEEYARAGFFGERIAHGMLAAGLITKVMGTQLPGPGPIYMSQSLRFRRPVKIGGTVIASVEITALNAEKRRVSLSTVRIVKGEPVPEGEALVALRSRAALERLRGMCDEAGAITRSDEMTGPSLEGGRRVRCRRAGTANQWSRLAAAAGPHVVSLA